MLDPGYDTDALRRLLDEATRATTSELAELALAGGACLREPASAPQLQRDVRRALAALFEREETCGDVAGLLSVQGDDFLHAVAAWAAGPESDPDAIWSIALLREDVETSRQAIVCAVGAHPAEPRVQLLWSDAAALARELDGHAAPHLEAWQRACTDAKPPDELLRRSELAPEPWWLGLAAAVTWSAAAPRARLVAGTADADAEWRFVALPPAAFELVAYGLHDDRVKVMLDSGEVPGEGAMELVWTDGDETPRVRFEHPDGREDEWECEAPRTVLSAEALAVERGGRTWPLVGTTTSSGS
jgi:hypothetical protein